MPRLDQAAKRAEQLSEMMLKMAAVSGYSSSKGAGGRRTWLRRQGPYAKRRGELEPAREVPLEAREPPESVDETGERNPPPSEEPREEATQRPWYQRWFEG